jgi:hypothetical protein
VKLDDNRIHVSPIARLDLKCFADVERWRDA